MFSYLFSFSYSRFWINMTSKTNSIKQSFSLTFTVVLTDKQTIIIVPVLVLSVYEWVFKNSWQNSSKLCCSCIVFTLQSGQLLREHWTCQSLNFCCYLFVNVIIISVLRAVFGSISFICVRDLGFKALNVRRCIQVNCTALQNGKDVRRRWDGVGIS